MSDDLEINDDAADDLTEALGGEETSFVAEEKKPINRGTLALTALLVAGAGVMYLMHLRAGPSSAMAAPPENAAARKTIDTFLSDGGKNIRLMQATLHNTEKLVQQFLNYPKMTQVPLADLKTNPFRFAPEKSKMTDAQAQHQREQARAAALQAVQSLRLQSLIAGRRKSCMINNTLYTEGQQVNGCTIEKIEGDRVIVRYGMFRFALRMQQ